MMSADEAQEMVRQPRPDTAANVEQETAKNGVHLCGSTEKGRSEDYCLIPPDVKTELSSQLKHEAEATAVNVELGKNANVNNEVFPIHKCSIFSLMTFHWINGFMWRVYKNGTVTNDQLWKCCPEESTEINGRRLANLWQEEVAANGLECASLIRVFERFIRSQFLIAVGVNFVNVFFTFIAPALLLRLILDYAKSSETNIGYGLALVISLFIADNGRTWSLMLQMHIGYLLAVRARSAMMYLVFTKILKLRSLKDKSAGELVNFFANDCQRLHELMYLLPMGLQGPLMVIVCTIYCVCYIGLWGFVGCGVILLYYPYQYVISRMTLYVRRLAIRVTDKRVRVMTEILSYIKLIKLYAWENSFARTVSAIRAKERKLLQYAAYLQTMSLAFTPVMPVFAAVCTFVGMIMTGTELTISQAFVIIAVFNITRMKVAMLPYIVRIWVDTSVGFVRAKEILLMEEFDSDSYYSKTTSEQLAIEILNASFAWDTAKQSKNLLVDPSAKQPKFDCRQRKTLRVDNTGDPYVADPLIIRHTTNGITSSDSKQRASAKSDGMNPDETKSAFSVDEFTSVLFDITFTVQKGKLYGICGAVGSGKSSLISAILGQMHLRNGSIALDGRLAYVPQQAWLINATLRENILFGMTYEKQRYEEVIEQCSLKSDIRILPARDWTEIGERGINLSGGQKQRISLARAIYSDRDVYLLDDPLSAVDAHVGQHLFEHCLRRAADNGKTVVFVTHQMQYLSRCDEIAVMKDGQFIEKGTHDQLMATGGDYATLIRLYYERPEKDEEHGEAEETQELVILGRTLSAGSGGTVGSTLSLNKSASVAGKLIEEEEIEKGSVTWNTYWTYCKAAGGPLVTCIILLSFALPVACSAFTDWWLSYWLSTHSSSHTHSDVNVSSVDTFDSNITTTSAPPTEGVKGVSFFALIYGLGAVGVIVTSCFRGFIYMMATLRASSQMHDRVFNKILHCPMSFFDVTPVGRLLNRFSKDLDEVDVRLPFNTEELLQNVCFVLAAFIMITISFPLFLVSMVIPAIIFVILQRIARVVMREVKRVDNVTRSPIYSHIAATVQGLHTIHAYNKENEFIDKLKTDVDVNSAAILHFYFSMRWLGIRLDILATLITFIVALVIVVARGYIPQAKAAIALVYAARLTGLFQYTIRLASEVEARFTSVERIHYYMLSVKQEPQCTDPSCHPLPSWPDGGEIKYEKYSLRYRPTLPLVLKEITCHIQPHEKIGVVGRTGSGKSSLVSALFRLAEPDSGSISIDNVDITTVDLEHLRSKLSIIPQDPVLFVGTIRYNLDPFGQHSDDEIWLALDKCRMNTMVLKLDGGLDAPVVENGENFSVGERQLLCLARALLRQSKILVMDEATAAIDTEMDAMIQSTIAVAFVDCTMLTIAHRLNTVLHCDRILVLDTGRIVEFDTPQNLLQNPRSLFAQMLQRSAEYSSSPTSS